MALPTPLQKLLKPLKQQRESRKARFTALAVKFFQKPGSLAKMGNLARC